MGTGTNLRSSETLTFSRVAMAFAPVTLLIRCRFRDVLQLRTGTPMNIIFADICLTPLKYIFNLPTEFDEFVLSFGELINSTRDRTQMFMELSAGNA
jgi:hypothetical protein